MSHAFDEAAVARLTDAVRAVESRSCAELVLEVHARAGMYPQAAARFGALLAIVSMLVLLVVPMTFPPYALLADALVFFLLGQFIARWSDRIRHLMTRRREREELVRLRASSLFLERGVGGTSGETGLLLYATRMERRIHLLADRGLLRMVNEQEWNALAGELHEERDISPDVLIAAIQRLDVLLARDAPAGVCNPDELANAPQLSLE
ncbi:MAG TPA: hypothetical protein VFN10_23095 [Thermoanaerobaculia bacterium]|nr:hypothetical protein [Thermoanaerobaculia bacterium]